MGVRAKILVVDDEAIVCRSFRRVLAADGYEVSVSSGGREAMLMIAGEDFDIALLGLS